MAKKQTALGKFVAFIAWLVGIIVSLSVGFALIDGTLGLPNWLGGTVGVPVAAGWITVFTTLLGAILVIIHKLR
ncbi:hypothetical protein DRN73_02075 [Candidatus Pacearchaeota archaeon]|nr:MAG: hypothetical protein DRN73_02075 [Candidatus Pacearchaeota archaeon]